MWIKLNYLVPEPQCDTKDGKVTAWFDTREQPTQEAIDAVDESVATGYYKSKKVEKDFIDAMDTPVFKAICEELESIKPGSMANIRARAQKQK